MNLSWGSYSSIYQIGHRAVKDLFTVECNVEEKCDGSQFSWGVFDAEAEDNAYSGRHIRVRSKGAVMHIDAPESLFKEACETVKGLAGVLRVGWTYRGECLKKPKHNALVYDRVPKGHIILFDITTEDGGFLSYEAKLAEAERIGLEVVPLLYSGTITGPEQIRGFLDTTSILGGQKIEGVVIKPSNYDLWGIDKKILMAKLVSDGFKEVHNKSWKEANPSNSDIITRIIGDYATPARFAKAVIHLRERGLIQDDVRDIGLIIKEVGPDVEKECLDEIKDRLFGYAWPHIRRGLTRGVPDWWKGELLKKQFEEKEEPCPVTVEATTTEVIPQVTETK